MAELQKVPWSEWETVRLIGRGSFGTVYEIQRKLVDEDTESAALKVITIPQNPGDVEELYSEGYDDESITATFNAHLKSIVAEYSLMRKMDGSANIVNCKDIRYIQHDDGVGWDIYIRMELLTPLMKALPADASEDAVIKLGRDICNALVLCKKHEIVHRDIKPQNIFISPNGDYKLGDFGIAKTIEKTMGGTKIGTYKYMAPEVYNNQPYGSAADIYSLGLVLYWLLNERRMPFMPLPPAKLTAGQDEQARLRRLSGETLPAPAHGSAALKQIVLKACAYDPKDRYESAAAMLSDLNKLDAGAGVVAPAVAAVTDQQEDDGTMGPVFLAQQEQTVGPNREKGNACPHCGAALAGQEKFCRNCGKTVAAAPIRAEEEKEPDTDATVGPIFVTKPTITNEQEKATATATATKSKGSMDKPLKYALIVLGVIAIMVFFFFLRSCDGKDASDREFTSGTNSQETSAQSGDVVLTNIIIETEPNQKSYYSGEKVNVSGLTLTATYSDGTMKTVTDGFQCAPETLYHVGTQSVAVIYEGKTVEFTVDVLPVSVSSISVKSGPSKTSYYVGQTLDTSGLTLTATYNNGTTETITSGFACTPNTLSSAGTQNITVSYGEKTATFSVDVTAVSVSSISVKTKPSKASYYVGETLSTTGLTLTATYNDGTTKTITDGYSCAPQKLNAVGTQNIEVYYNGQTTSFSVTVEQLKATSISIRKKPKTTFLLGDKLDTNGLELDVVLSNGWSGVYDTGYSISCADLDMHTVGTYTIKVTLYGASTSYDISVSDAVYIYLVVDGLYVKENRTYAQYDGTTPDGNKYWVFDLPDAQVFSADGVSRTHSWRVTSGPAYISGKSVVVYPQYSEAVIRLQAYVEINGYTYSTSDYVLHLILS